MLTVESFDHLVINVSDVNASAAWYERVLGMKRVDSVAQSGQAKTSVVFGINKINLRPAELSQALWVTGKTPCPGSDDICFLTQVSPDRVAAHFHTCGVAILDGPAIRSGALGQLCSIYVHDPDGNLIEVSSYL